MTGNSGYFVLGGSRDCSIKGVVPAVLVIMDYRNVSIRSNSRCVGYS